MRIAHAKDRVKRLGIKAPLRNHIKEYISKYGDFHFSKQETVSGDVIRFDSWVMALYNPYWEEFHERVAFLGGYRNCSCSLCGRQETFYIEAFYMNSAGCIYNQRRDRCYANIAKEAVRTEERWILRNYGWDTICVGFCNQGEDMIWLTPFGQIVIRQEAVGRTFMEAVNCIVGY